MENNIICWFGVPQEIVLDNGTHFEGEVQRIMEFTTLSSISLHHTDHRPMGPQKQPIRASRIS